MISKHLSLEPLQVIWHETSQITEWGSILHFIRMEPMQSNSSMKSLGERIIVCVPEKRRVC